MRIENERLLDEFREPCICEWCGKPVRHPDACHLFSRGAGRVDIRCNLMSMHRICHSITEKNQDYKAKLLEIVAKREGISPEDIEPVVMFIRNQLDKRWSRWKCLETAALSDQLTLNQKCLVLRTVDGL